MSVVYKVAFRGDESMKKAMTIVPNFLKFQFKISVDVRVFGGFSNSWKF